MKRSELILVVDDNYTNRILLAHRLKRLGFLVDLASNGQEALEFLCGKQYSLVFLDIQMPGMSGFEVLREIRLADSNTPIVAWTCSINKKDPYFLEAGFDDELDKPLDTSDFFRIVDRFLGIESAQTTLSGEYDTEVAAISDEL